MKVLRNSMCDDLARLKPTAKRYTYLYFKSLYRGLQFFIFLFSSIICFASAEADTTFTDYLPSIELDDSIRFRMCIDTIHKYMYRDGQLVDYLLEETELIRHESNQISKAQILDYATEKIYYELSKDELLKSYQIISKYEDLLNNNEISTKVKGQFQYISGFTYMSIGDLTAAINIFHELTDKASESGDKSMLFSSLYSLAQLYADEKDYESAKKHFLELKKLSKSLEIPTSTEALLNYELSELYIDIKQFEKAQELIENSLVFIEEKKLDRLRPDFLFLQGDLALKQNRIDEARAACDDLSQLVSNNKDPLHDFSHKFLHAAILKHQKHHIQALDVYDSIIAKLDTNQLDRKFRILELAHEVAFNLGDHLKAYEYATLQNEIGKKIQEKKKEQKTAYLNIKFETEQKEKENQKLALEVIQNQSQNRLLCMFLSLLALGLIMLYSAFYQKKKYNLTLCDEVDKRTKELQESVFELNNTNKELFQFSHVCSHDLKEPILSIKNFLGLIERDSYNQDNAPYFDYVNKNLNRLSTLLEKIRIYFEISKKETLEFEYLDINALYGILHSELLDEIKKKNAIFRLENQLGSEYIKCSKFELILTLKELIHNSLRFNISERPEITLAFSKQKDFLKIDVIDNGIGIQEKYFDYIFLPFKTLDNSSKYESSGLGLAICKKVIEAFGGEITVSSNDKGGSTFTILFNGLPSENERVVHGNENSLQKNLHSVL